MSGNRSDGDTKVDIQPESDSALQEKSPPEGAKENGEEEEDEEDAEQPPVPKKSKRVSKAKDPSAKRLSPMEKVAKEGEALLKELGHKDAVEGEGRRRTRSQTRGGNTPSRTPSTPARKTKTREAAKGRRGRPKKDEEEEEEDEDEEEEEEEDAAKEEASTEEDEAKANNEESKSVGGEDSEEAAETAPSSDEGGAPEEESKGEEK